MGKALGSSTGGGGGSSPIGNPNVKSIFYEQQATRTTPSSSSRSLNRQRGRQQFRNSDILLALIIVIACISSFTHIFLHSSHDTTQQQHPHHRNSLKETLDNFVQQASSGNRQRQRQQQDSEASTYEGSDEEDANRRTPEQKIPNSNGNDSNGNDKLHPVAHLNCADHGGPTNQKIINEMVFWSDIPSDASYLSPMHPLNDPHTPDDTERFLTFEPNHGGWNNIRMAMETALVLSHGMGRTLVLPPEHSMYLLGKGDGQQKNQFGFNDFFHLDAISMEHKGFKAITMEEFLVKEAMQGKMVEYGTNTTLYPPDKQTSWDGRHSKPLFDYLRKIGNTPSWEPWDCALAIPSSTEPEAMDELRDTLKSILDGSYGKPRPTLEEFNSNPTPVNASMAERMREMVADKHGDDENKLCFYDKALQQSKLIHLKSSGGTRLLTHFYAFIFFADWKQDLWSKRFVRDHLRYVDDIMCAAARVIEAVREHAKENKNCENNRDGGIYDALHVRRGDFQYPPVLLPAEELYNISKDALPQGCTLYIATDERVSNELYYLSFVRSLPLFSLTIVYYFLIT